MKMALSHGLCICNRWHCFMMKWLDGLQIMYWEKQAACILEFRELGEAAEMGILMLCEENWFGKLSRPLPTEKYREEGKWLSIQIIQDIVLAILFIFLALNGLWEKQKELYTLSTELLRRAIQGWCTIILSHEMSKSKKNYIGITDPANDMFGKVMSITDDLMWNWYDLLSLRSNAEIAQLKKECAEGRNPRDAKVLLAREIIERFHDKAAADAAEAEFNARFQKGAVPNDIKDVTVAAPTGEIGIMQLIKAAGLAPSNAEAGRNIDQGGVRIDGETVRDRTLKIQAGAEFVLQVGKRRWARVKVTAQ